MAPKRAASDLQTPSPKPKRARETPVKMPSMSALSCATKEQLVELVKGLCTKYPVVRQDVRDFSPSIPVDQMLAEIQKAANLVDKKLPYDRYGRGNNDTYAYNRVRTFISAFSKLVSGHLKTVEKSKQLDKLEEFIDGCEGCVNELHEFSDARQNAAKSRLQAALAKAGAKIGRQPCSDDASEDGFQSEE
mmetsp:Transcript_27419/g.49644  ORF Transcript_27419/g.49644 Transcript_27419/m.49644 type:complete len:190 (+) Transcript_27419:51-620(+)|eukprot:CAMPEP_0197639376 /NCGR_PEP_ID=MMETSP1338-20131121/14014_1 /TAXON_ID=43686 ORGANISM="Pelagodinium beii, Strain RCC1491" /NCGR_SAMPLE_ID=MMETSP1338 /ASSEMBLY_ACC=CAM_ASM_000754 /LENGTH=189 /DNA_ID=CAMNT_0043212093 /DNA_START=51 /DNA_END=620 /DNA_ORIENTATION=-